MNEEQIEICYRLTTEKRANQGTFQSVYNDYRLSQMANRVLNLGGY